MDLQDPHLTLALTYVGSPTAFDQSQKWNW